MLNTKVKTPVETEVKWNFLKNSYPIIVFVLMTVCLIVFPSISQVLKYLGVPIILLSLFKKEEFLLLMFPVCLFELTWGQIIFGRIGLLTVYLILFFLKIFLEKPKKIRINYQLLIVFILSIYCLYSYILVSNNEWLRIALYGLCIWIACSSGIFRFLKQEFLYIILISSLAVGITLCFELNGVEKFVENGIVGYRALGLGFTDPNYSACICCMGVCVALNLPSIKYKGIFQWLSILILFAGILKSGSRTGIICLVLLLLLNYFLIKGISKKIGFILLGLTVFCFFLIFLLPKLDFMDAIFLRFKYMVDSFFNIETVDVTSGRSTLVTEYLKYFTNQDIFRMLFGFNVLQSNSLLSAVGVTHAAHNTYIDYLLSFGLVGSGITLGVYSKKTLEYFKNKSPENNAYFMIKICGLLFAFSLSFVSRILWWFLVLI